MRHPRPTVGAEAAHVAPTSNERDSYRPWYPVPAPVPAGLNGAEAAAVEASLGASPGAWCAVRHEDEAGEVSVLVMARDAADDAAPTHVVHRDGALLRLDVCRGDAYTRLGAYAAMAPLTRALAAALAGARAEGLRTRGRGVKARRVGLAGLRPRGGDAEGRRWRGVALGRRASA